MDIMLDINCSDYNLTMAYEFRKIVASHLAREHNAAVTWIGKYLPGINIKKSARGQKDRYV